MNKSLFAGSFANKCGVDGPVMLTNKDIVRSVSGNQTEIIRWIMGLYCPNGFDLDPTYSVGNFYKSIKEPRIKMDLSEPINGGLKADARYLPIKSNSVSSVMFDPPFVAGSPRDPENAKLSIIKKRFGYYKDIQKDLWGMYAKALIEFYRVLKSNGVLVFKCQDTIDSGKQCLTHVEVINQANKIGFYPKDMFILTANVRILRQERQFHARKFHSYFLVFIKQKSPVKYTK